MKILFFSVTILFITCKKNDIECFDSVTKTFSPNKEIQSLFNTISGKTLQFRDSLGNKLDFKVGETLDHHQKFFYKKPCGYHDWSGLGEHYIIKEPFIYLVSQTFGIVITYKFSVHLDKAFPDPVGTEILIICVSDSSQNCNFAIAEVSPIGQPQILNNSFKNTYLGNLTFTVKKDVLDTVGENRSYQNVWKAAFKSDYIGSNSLLQASKNLVAYSATNEKIPHEFYFNNTHGLIAFRFKDGKFWIQYGSF